MRFRPHIDAGVFGSPLIGGMVYTGAITGLFSANSPSHRVSDLAQPVLIGANVVVNVLIAASFAAVFAALLWAHSRLKRTPELQPHLWIFVSFAIFILACGAVRAIDVVTIWWPVSRLSDILKVVCALVTVPTSALFAWKISDLSTSIRTMLDLLTSVSRQKEELRKSQAFLDRTGRIAGIGGWEVDLKTDRVTWSPETYRILGVPLDFQPTLQDGIKMYAPEARPVIIAAILTASAGGPGWDLELSVIRVDGRRITVRCAGEADLHHGKAVRLLGAFQDITDQVAAREALRKATERVSLATQSGDIGTFDWDIQADLCIADSWMYRLWGEDDPCCGKPLQWWAEPVHPEDRPKMLEALEDAIAGRRPYDLEFRVVWRDGSLHHLRSTARVTYDDFGTPTHMLGANWDVTDARRLTAELAEQHDLLRVTLQSIGDGVITTDLDRNVSWLNPAAERMTGWSMVEACGQPLIQIFNTLNAETGEPVENPVANFVAQGDVVGVARQTVLVSRTGVEFGIENQAAPIRDGNSKLIGNILVFRDVTEQRRLAAETEHVTKLQLELKTKDEFLSHVSHELRSPLTSIYSFTSIIADGLAGETTHEQKEYLQIVLKNVVQLQSMIEDLLTVTQSREGKLNIELQCVDPLDAVNDAIHTLSSAALTKQITFSRVEIGHESSDLPTVCADPTRLRQILIILLDNAIKFTPRGGSVSVAIAETDRDGLLFQVTDTGCGIPEEKRTQVFENLYQITGPAPPDTSQLGRIGLGLGLHIARNLVTRLGGRIWITDGPGGGSILNFTLPVCSAGLIALPDKLNSPLRRKPDAPIAPPSPIVTAA